MREIHRVARSGALVDIVVPYANTLHDVANPYHKHRFNHLTFLYFCCGHGPTNDLDLAWRGFLFVEHRLREVGQEEWEGFVWRLANYQVKLRVVK
jgi:hypothetical protein